MTGGISFYRRNGQFRRHSKRLELEAPVGDDHSVPDVSEIIHGGTNIEVGEEFRLRVDSSSVVVVDHVLDLLHSASVNDPIVSIERQVVAHDFAHSGARREVLGIALEALQLRLGAFWMK